MTTPTTAESAHPWTTYVAAREEARRQGDRRVGTDHLLLGLLHDSSIEAVLGVTLDAARSAAAELDRRALESIGLDQHLDAPLLPAHPLPARPTVRTVVTGRLPLTPASKRVLQVAAKPVRRRRQITALQVLAVLLAQRRPDPAIALLDELDVDSAAVHDRLGAPPAA